MERNLEIKVNLNSKMNNKKSNPINNNKILNSSTCSLPKDFFETVLYCETKLKEKFNIKIFNKLANYYSTAIDYYESINDPKFMLYNQNLSILFSQTEAKKYFSDGINIKAKIQKDKNKKKIENCDKKITNNKVKKFIKKNLENDTKSVIKDMINKDIAIQENDFRKRLAEKKKRYLLSKSDNLANHCISNEFKNIGGNNRISNSKFSDKNESIDFISDSEFMFNDKDISNINSNTDNTHTYKNSDGDNESSNNIQILINNTNILEEAKVCEMKENDDKNNIMNDSFGNKLDYKLEKNSKSTSLSIISKNNIKCTNKTMFLEKMKFNFDIYSNDYYDFFIKKIAHQIITDYSKNYNELTQSITDIVVNSNNQQKEMEYLLNSDSDDTYKKEISTIIEQLKDEEEVSKEKLTTENNQKIEKINDKYIGTLDTFQLSHDIGMIKERLKLDTTKNLNTYVFK